MATIFRHPFGRRRPRKIKNLFFFPFYFLYIYVLLFIFGVIFALRLPFTDYCTLPPSSHTWFTVLYRIASHFPSLIVSPPPLFLRPFPPLAGLARSPSRSLQTKIRQLASLL